MIVKFQKISILLCELPGVGRKTANVVMSVAFGHTTIAVDTHVYRLSRRLNLSLGETPDAVEKDLMDIVPDQYKKNRPPSSHSSWSIYLQGTKS